MQRTLPPYNADPNGQTAYARLHAAARRCLRAAGRTSLIQTTALANEAWLKSRDLALHTEAPAAVAALLRSILIDAARREGAAKRGRGWRRIPLGGESLEQASSAPAEGYAVDLLDLDDALIALERVHPRAARIVELRFFAGLTVPQTAALLEVSDRTVELEFRLARALLRAALDPL
jgi:RNA polymerase sigma factor (TIGR02999 family)